MVVISAAETPPHGAGLPEQSAALRHRVLVLGYPSQSPRTVGDTYILYMLCVYIDVDIHLFIYINGEYLLGIQL